MNQPSATGRPGPRIGPHLVLYSRSWCHLCEDMLGALRACMARQGLPYTVDVVDVDADPALVARFDELVPVLVADGTELCHYFLDEAALLAWLGGPGQRHPESAEPAEPAEPAGAG